MTSHCQEKMNKRFCDSISWTFEFDIGRRENLQINHNLCYGMASSYDHWFNPWFKIPVQTRLPLGAKIPVALSVNVDETEASDDAGNRVVVVLLLFMLNCCWSCRMRGPTAAEFDPALRRPMLAARSASEWGCWWRSSERGPRLSGRPWLPRKTKDSLF